MHVDPTSVEIERIVAEMLSSRCVLERRLVLTPNGNARLDVGKSVTFLNGDGSGKDYVSFHWVIPSSKKAGALGDIGKVTLELTEAEVMGRRVTFLDVGMSVRDQGWKSDITHIVELHDAHGVAASLAFRGPSFFHSAGWNASGQRAVVSDQLKGLEVVRVEWTCKGPVWNS